MRRKLFWCFFRSCHGSHKAPESSQTCLQGEEWQKVQIQGHQCWQLVLPDPDFHWQTFNAANCIGRQILQEIRGEDKKGHPPCSFCKLMLRWNNGLWWKIIFFLSLIIIEIWIYLDMPTKNGVLIGVQSQVCFEVNVCIIRPGLPNGSTRYE